MPKVLRKAAYLAAMLLMLFNGINHATAQTVFTDNFNRASLSPGGTPSMTYTSTNTGAGSSAISGSSFLQISNGNPAGRSYVRGPLSTYSAPFNATLTSNTSQVTWTFNMRYNRTSAPGGFDNNLYGIATVLAASGTDFTTANGYAVVYGGTETTKRYKLVRFAGGLDANANITDIITSTSAAPANANNYVSIRVVYDPSNDNWSLYFRDDGTSAWTSAASGVTTQVGSTTANTTYTSTAMTSFGFLWNYSNAGGQTAQFDNFNVQVCQNANAGADQANCNSGSFTMAGNTPSAGTGAWSVISGTATITTASSATTTVTGVPAGTSATLRWTITNATCITTDDVILTNNALPTTANAGPDQTGAATCGLTSVTLAANTPSVGTGAWSIVSGTGGTITTASSPTSTFTGTAGNTYTLRWTISNANCTASTDDVVVTFNRNPTTANAGPDQTQCNNGDFTLAGNNPTIGTGSWSVVSGTATITNAASPTSTVTGVPAGTSATLRWTVSNSPCTASTDDVVLTNSDLPTTSNAGPDQNDILTCGVTTVAMAANTPSVGTGAWSIVSGTGGSIANPGSPISNFTGTAGNTYTLRWTITNGACTSTDDVIVTFNRNPTTANAGADQTLCNVASFTLAGNNPTVGTGTWTVVLGSATITNPASRTSTVTGIAAGSSATLRWTIANSPCNSSFDDVVLTNSAVPTTSNAGADQANCNSGSFTLAGNTPSVGTGVWTVTSGTATIATPSSPTSAVTGVPAGSSATLTWTITNGACTSADAVVLANNATPTTANAGADQTNCNSGSFTMAGNNPTAGSGLWTLVSGTANITTPTSRTSGITGVPAGTSATLRWTISNGVCPSNSDDVVLTNRALPTTANAGTNQTNCNNSSFTLAGNTPVNGTGTWTVVSGTATITTPSSPTSTVTGVPAGTSATLRWTIANSPCTASTDDVILTNNDQPITTGIDICQGGSGSLSSAYVCPNASPITTAATNAGRGVDSAGVGTGVWNTPGNITTTGTPYATQNLVSNGTTRYLKATNYNFNIPANATINGISVSIRRQVAVTSSCVDNVVRLVKAGTISGTNFAGATAATWPNTFGVATYGGSSNLWGTTWTPSDINNNNFGVVLSAFSGSGSTRQLDVDYIQVTITYTAPGSIDWYTVSSGGTAVHSGSTFNPVNDPQVLAAGAPYNNLSNSNTPGVYTFYAECSTVPGCRTQTDFVINESPTISLGLNPTVLRSVTSANLSYSATTASPDLYSITWSGAAPGQGFSNVADAALPSSPISIIVPATANAATYNATLTVKNSINGCSSAGDNISVTVDPVALTITGVTANNKTYDGNNTATLSGTPAYNGLVNSESFSVSGTPVATFNDKNAGNGKPVTVTGYTGPNSNYTVAQPGGLTANIDKASITASLTGSAVKTYDGNTTATVSNSNFSLTGVINPDDVTVTNTSGTYDNKNVAGSPTKTVTVTGLTLGGADAANYDLTNAASVNGNIGTINALAVTVTPDAGQFKVFGGADPVFTYTNTPALISPDAFTGALSRNAGESLGTYPYTLGTLNAGNNYSLSLGGSNTFEIQAISQSTADFRSKANGNFSAAATWEYDLGGGNWQNATQAPGSNNNVSITHNVGLNQDYTVGAGKTFALGTGAVVTVKAGRTLTIAGNADFGGQPVTFESGNSSTASLGVVTGSLTGATNVTVERYIPNNSFRSWRLLSVPTSSTRTIRQSWQEGDVNPNPKDNNLPGYGTQITGVFNSQVAAAAAGFDSTSVSAGMLTWNGIGWSNVTSTNQSINNSTAYFLYVRGDRSQTVTGTAGNASATTLRTKGSLFVGDQVNTIGANSFALVPNQYASAIDFTGLTRTGGVSNTFYIWDSKKMNGSSLGAYQTFSGTNGFICLLGGGSFVLGQPNTSIESGQAFFVQSTTAGTITLKETAKTNSTGNGHHGLRPANTLVKIDTRLYSNNNMLDANVVVFDPAYSNSVDGDDAIKLGNPGENIAIKRNNINLAIEGRQPAANDDVVPFWMWGLQQQTYTFEFISSNFSTPGLTAWLEDSYLNSSTPVSLDGTTTVNFTVNSAAGSSVANRFRIVFKQASPVPVSFISISGIRSNADVKVNWTVASERNVKHYEVERSTNGSNFSKIATVAAVGNSNATLSYTFTDASAQAGTLYYRIRSVDADGNSRYSSVVKLNSNNVKPGFTIAPNPVVNGIVNLQLKNQAAGKYGTRIIAADGTVISTSVINHEGGNSNKLLYLPAHVTAGTYQLEITAPDKTKTVQTVFVNQE